MHQALAAVRDDVRLRGTPPIQCRGPFLRAAHIEDFATGVDYAAVDSTGGERRSLARHDCHHSFIEQ